MTLSERAVRRLVLGLVVAAIACAAWSAAVFISGGFVASLLGLRISSRNPHNPLVLAVFAGVNALALQLSRGREPIARVPSAVPALVAGLLAAGSFATCLTHAAFVAGSADAYGYISQADLWQSRELVVPQPLAAELPWPEPDWVMSPLGYRPATTPHAIVPTYSAGYPIVMAMLQGVAGSGAGLYIVPLAAAGLVWCTFVLGRRLAGAFIGVAAALLIATSPPALFQGLMPMSDVPTAFWWSLAGVGAGSTGQLAHVTAAAAVALGILTRPNLAPLAGLLVVFAWFTHRNAAAKVRWRSMAAVVAGGAVGAGAVAWINHTLYGSPLRSGYGGLGGLYEVSFFPVNIVRYSQWAIDAHTPLFFLFVGGMFVWRWIAPQARPLFGLGVATILFMWVSYMFYTPFENWTYLRFLLPAYPYVFAIGLALPLALTSRWRTPVQVAVLSVACGVMVAKHLDFDRNQRILELSLSEIRYREVAEYIGRRTPKNAVVLAMQHGGSVRYYGDRNTLRWDWLPEGRLNEVLEFLAARGLRPFFVLEDWEEVMFVRRFGTASEAGRLRWAPTAQFGKGAVRIYDPAGRANP